MLTITASVSSDDLLQAAAQLNEAELDAFVAQLIAFQAKRKAPSLSAAESTLLQYINTPFAQQARYRELITLRRAESLSSTEYAELMQLMEQAEAYQAEWLAWLAQLGQLRGRTLRQIMDDLGIKQPAYE